MSEDKEETPIKEERYVPLENIHPRLIPKVSEMIPRGQKIRVRDLLFGVESINDKSKTVKFKIIGVFPREQPKPPAK